MTAPRAGQATDKGDPSAERWPPLRYWAKVTAVVVGTAALLVVARSVANVLILIVVSMVLAVGAEPITERLTARGLARGWAVATVVGSFVVLLALFGLLIVPSLVRQASGLGDDVPRYLAGLERRSDWLGDYVRENHVADKVRGFIQDLPEKAGQSFGTILSVAGRVGTVLFGVVTVAVLTIYFMLTLPSMRRTALILVRPHNRSRATRVIDSSIERIGGYVVGNLVTSAVCGAVSVAALLLLGVPFAIPLAAWAGLADLIPAVGAYLGAAPAVIVAFIDSPVTGIVTVIYFIGYQQFENYVLVPRVMRNAVNLSPPAVIIATLMGGSLAGLAGALLALPVAATIKVVLVEVWLRERVADGDRLARERIEEDHGDPTD